MFDANQHIIHIVDGRLSPKSKTSRDDLGRIVTQALAANAPSGIVLHFHGGLVSESSARESAEEALSPLRGAGEGLSDLFRVGVRLF